MNTVMYLSRLEDFTPKVALKVLKKYMSTGDKRHIKVHSRNLNRVFNGICDNQMIKYVVSIGDGLYQIVAVDSNKMSKDRVSVVVDYFQLCGTRQWAKEVELNIKKFDFNVALSILKESMSEYDSNRYRLSICNLNRINNGILDRTMIKYVVSTGYGLYQIVGIKLTKNLTSVIVKYSQI